MSIGGTGIGFAHPFRSPRGPCKHQTCIHVALRAFVFFLSATSISKQVWMSIGGDRNWLCPSLPLAAWPLQAPNVHTRGSASLCLLFIPYIHFQTSLDVYRGIKRRTPLGMSLYARLVLAEREALEPTYSRNIIKLQIINNQALFGVHSKSKSF
jgi:hypothetical protein